MIDAATLAIGLLAGGFWILAALSVILALAALLSVFRNEIGRASCRERV